MVTGLRHDELMSDSLALDSDALEAVITRIGTAIGDATGMRARDVPTERIDDDFRGDVRELATVWREESQTCANYLRDFRQALTKAHSEMLKAEAEIARAAGAPQ